MLNTNKPKSTGNFLDYLIEQSYVGTIVKDGLDLATLRGNVLNKYDAQIVGYFKSIGTRSNTYPILLLCFYMALSRAIKIKNNQLDTKIADVQDSNDQENLYYYLVMFRPFFLFHIVYSKLDGQDNSDYKAFFEENYGFINELGKDYYTIIYSIADFFQNKSELGPKDFMKELIKIKSQKLEEFVSTFVETKWDRILIQALRKIKEHSIKDKNNVLEDTTNLFDKLVEKMTSSDVRASSNLEKLKNIFSSEKYLSNERIFILPYFSTTESGYYTSIAAAQDAKDKLHFAYFKYGRSFWGSNSDAAHNKNVFGVMSNLFDLIIFEALSKQAHFKHASDFIRTIRMNEMIDFLILYTEHKSEDLIKKIDDIFKIIHNAQYNEMSNGTALTNLIGNGRYYYESLMTEYMLKLIATKRDKFRDILRDTFEEMENQRKKNIAPGIREFTRAIVNNMVSELENGFYPIDYELLETGSYKNDLVNIFNAANKPRDYKNNYETLVKELGTLISECFGERRWETLSEK